MDYSDDDSMLSDNPRPKWLDDVSSADSYDSPYDDYSEPDNFSLNYNKGFSVDDWETSSCDTYSVSDDEDF